MDFKSPMSSASMSNCSPGRSRERDRDGDRIRRGRGLSQAVQPARCDPEKELRVRTRLRQVMRRFLFPASQFAGGQPPLKLRLIQILWADFGWLNGFKPFAARCGFGRLRRFECDQV